ncbi:hypothetical protein ACJIZ3_009359 [Penstemon smallii]|uniref:Uncharacterized protein n=1 Tax=Penstemon smallii TaxID=265156 RepID=A0ABD3TDI5_9LAMI
MPVKSSLFILLMYFFVHACNARRYGLSYTSNFHKRFPPDKIEENLKFSMKYSPNGNKKFKDAEVSCKNKNIDIKGAKSGSEDCEKLSLQKAVNATTLKVSRRARVNFRDSSILSYEDLIETDYQQPRHNSPIHNK